jgi:hypothetical protein
LVDLADHLTRPAISPEGLLRALGVSRPGDGVDWESRLRGTVLLHELSGAMPYLNLPESGYVVTQPLVGGVVAAVEIVGGQRGTWVTVGDSTQATVQVMRWNNQGENIDALGGAAVQAAAYQIDGGSTGIVVTGQASVFGPAFLEGALGPAGVLYGRSGFWVKPGGVLRIAANALGTLLTLSLLLRDPLAAP